MVNVYRGGNDAYGHFTVANGTALHWAVYYGQQEIAKLLIEKGAGMYMCIIILTFKSLMVKFGSEVLCFTSQKLSGCTAIVISVYKH